MRLLEYGLALLVVLAGLAVIGVMVYRASREEAREQARKDRQFRRDEDEEDLVHDRIINPDKYKE